MPGLPGTVAGVTVLELADAAPVPLALTACTLKLYAVPLVRPETSALGVLPETVSVLTVVPPIRTCTSQPVTGDPPSLPGVQLRLTLVLPRTAVTAVGALGTPTGVTALDGAESRPAPKRLLARTWKVYGLLVTRPVTTR